MARPRGRRETWMARSTDHRCNLQVIAKIAGQKDPDAGHYILAISLAALSPSPSPVSAPNKTCSSSPPSSSPPSSPARQAKPSENQRCSDRCCKEEEVAT
ncbi:hypothetical protein ZWY2020_010087 [Hordeum vulgare]|nr:hypothetical protein ZWY2020_010087 [Hordeum vulgare]